MNKIIKNISYLYIIQIINQLFPLFLFPILIREIGINEFGIFQFAISFFAFLFVFIDYGHNLNASREIAILKKEEKSISKYFWLILSSRIYLYILSFIIINIFLITTDIFSSYDDVLQIFWLYLLGVVLFPMWFFQGIEKMILPLTIQLIFKIFILILVVTMVESQSGLITVSWIYSILTLVQSFVILLIILKYFNINIIIPSYEEVLNSLSEGKVYFYAQGATALFSSINPLILGIFSTPSIVGIYTLADKIVRSAVLIVGVINKVIYPISARKFNGSIAEGVIFTKKILKIGFIIMTLISSALYFAAPIFSQYFLGYISSDIVLFIRILALLPLTIFINNIFGNQILLNINGLKEFSYIIYSTLLLSIFSMLILVPLIGGVGIAISSLISEIYIALATTFVSLKVLKESGVNYFEL